MGSIQLCIIDELTNLRALTLTDFSALARLKMDERIHFEYVSGNRNERYKQILLKSGRGLAGMVIRFGHTVVLDKTIPDADRKREEDPIMLAEHLLSAVVTPVMVGGKIWGVLIIGNRTKCIHSLDEVHLVVSAADKLAFLIDSL